MTEKQFFKMYPKADLVYRVGKRLFFECYLKEAQKYAYATNQEVQVIQNPKAKK